MRHSTPLQGLLAALTTPVLALSLLLVACTGERPPADARCGLCGMNATASRGRFALEFEDGTRFDACSGRCAAVLAARQTAPLYRIRVFAHDRSEMIDGRTAFYVIGAGSIPEGSMAPSVFAVSSQAAAERLVGELGGQIIGLDAVLALGTAPGGGGGERP